MRKQVLIFGLVGGVLVTLLQWTEFHFIIFEHSVAIYGVLIAILFAGAGIWLGTRILAPRERIVEIAVPAAPAPPPKLEIDDQARERLKNSKRSKAPHIKESHHEEECLEVRAGQLRKLPRARKLPLPRQAASAGLFFRAEFTLLLKFGPNSANAS